MKISVVSPYYNEEPIIEGAINCMLKQFSFLPYEWELILVNDGSLDNGPRIVERLSRENKRIIPLGYDLNKGRGFALKKGISCATGDIIVTTEIDCSWGDDIVLRLVERIASDPSADFVIASPNLKGGGYQNVPLQRVLLSKIGNIIIRIFFIGDITMNTGMTRAYRSNVIKGLDIDEDRKEFHLEVLLKLKALGYKAVEIPATLRWRNFPSGNALSRGAKKGSPYIWNFILGHLKFVIFANPLRYFWLFSFICGFLGFCVELYGIMRLIRKEVAIYVLLLGLLLLLFCLLFFGIGVITYQNKYIMKELWKKRREGI